MRRKWMIIGGLCLTCSASALGQTYQELTERAIAATEQDSLRQAERYIQEALQLEPANPHNVLLFSNLGTIQRRLKKYDLAEESYTFALNFVPRAVPILLNRATLYMEMGKLDAARVDYSMVLDLDKDNKEALLMRAYIYMQMHDYKASEADYKHLLKADPSDFNGRLGLATLQQKMGKPDEALLVVNTLIAECAKDEDVDEATRAMLYVARAGIEKDLQHPELALVDLEEAIRLDPAQPEAYLVRGQIYLSQEKKTLAKRDFEQAIARGIPQADLHELLRSCK